MVSLSLFGIGIGVLFVVIGLVARRMVRHGYERSDYFIVDGSGIPFSIFSWPIPICIGVAIIALSVLGAIL